MSELERPLRRDGNYQGNLGKIYLDVTLSTRRTGAGASQITTQASLKAKTE